MTNVNYLLPCHRHLLNQDFHQLSNADTLPCQLWVASMKSTISAASHVAYGHYTPGSMQIFNSRPDSPQAHHDLTERLYPPQEPNPPEQDALFNKPSHPHSGIQLKHHLCNLIHPRHIKQTSQGHDTASFGGENRTLSSRLGQV